MAGAENVAIDHKRIRHWVQEHNGRPATVRKPPAEGGAAGPLKIDFPDYSAEDTLQHISWDEFFAQFEEANLAFVYHEDVDGGESPFCKLVDRNTVNVEED